MVLHHFEVGRSHVSLSEPQPPKREGAHARAADSQTSDFVRPLDL